VAEILPHLFNWVGGRVAQSTCAMLCHDKPLAPQQSQNLRMRSTTTSYHDKPSALRQSKYLRIQSSRPQRKRTSEGNHRSGSQLRTTMVASRYAYCCASHKILKSKRQKGILFYTDRQAARYSPGPCINQLATSLSEQLHQQSASSNRSARKATIAQENIRRE
jgi:hypothetical protein